MSLVFTPAEREGGAQSDAVSIDGIVRTSGIRAIDPDTGTLIAGSFKDRVLQTLANVDRLLARSTGTDLQGSASILSAKVYVRNLRDTPDLFSAMHDHFVGRPLPCLTVFEVNRLRDDHDIEIDCLATAESSGVEVIQADSTQPSAAVVRNGEYVYCSALTEKPGPVDYGPDDFLAEVNGVLDALSMRLKSAGAELSDVYTTRVYVTNMKDRYLVNQAYTRHFDKNPLRVITEVPRLPGNRHVAIEAEAHTGKGREYIRTEKGQKPTGPFTQGIRIGKVVYCSGVRPVDPATARLVKGDFRDRAIRCMENLRAIVEAGGASMSRTFETRVYIRNLANLPTVDDVFREYFDKDAFPVRTAVEISRLNEDYEKGWEPNHDIEIQCSALLE